MTQRNVDLVSKDGHLHSPRSQLPIDHVRVDKRSDPYLL